MPAPIVELQWSPGISGVQSAPWIFRECFIAVLQPLFPEFTILRNKRVPVQPEQLPVLGVYIVSERMTPDGEFNAGNVRFIHNWIIGFSIIIASNSSPDAEQAIDFSYWRLMNGLWCNASLMNLLGSDNPDNLVIEGLTAGNRRHVWGAVGARNETPTVEAQFEVTGTHRWGYDPIIPDRLDLIVETAIPAGFDPSKTPPVNIRYDFTQGSSSNGRSQQSTHRGRPGAKLEDDKRRLEKGTP
jgi:hypothetical protein